MKEAKAPVKGIIKPDKRVGYIADNIIKIKGIRVRPKYWKRPGHPKYKDFIIFSNGPYWTKEYNFLGLPEEHEKLRAKVLLELQEKTPEGDYKHKRLPYYALRNRNNQLTLCFQNRRQLDFIKPNTVIFFGDLKYGKKEDGTEDKTKPPVEIPALYFIQSWDYADNDKLFTELRCEKDNIGMYHGNILDAGGYGQITKSRIGHEHENHTLGYNWKADGRLKEDNGTHEKAIPGCPACNDCFDFCDDLKVKRSDHGYRGDGSRYATPQGQPQYGILYIKPKGMKGATNSFSFISIPEAGNLQVPNNMQVARGPGGGVSVVLSEAGYTNGMPAILFMVDKSHFDHGEHSVTYTGSDNTTPTYAYAKAPDGTTNYWHELPEIYNEQPHLMNHSSVQFYFQKKVIFTANCRHLSMGRKRTGNHGGVPVFVLHYRIRVKSSVSGILYEFTSGDIFYRWELEVRGSLINQSILGTILGGLVTNLMENVGGAVLGGIVKGAANGFGLGGVVDSVTGDVKKTKKKGALTDILTPEKYAKLAGAEEKKGKNEDKPATEQQTDRKTKDTGKKRDLIISPAIFYASTVDFNYDFWEFSNRAILNPFMIRFEHSEVLYNNLTNNNAAHPIRSLDIDFKHGKQVLVPGYVEGRIWLSGDPDGGYAALIARGVRYIRGPEDFLNFKYKYRGLTSYTPKSISTIQGGQGEEKVEVEKIDKDEVLMKADMSSADYGVSDYIGASGALWDELNSKNNNCHPGSVPGGMGNCLGCLCGGGSHGDPNYRFFREYDFTVGGTLLLKTRGSGLQQCTIPEGGGKVVFKAEGNSGEIVLRTSTENYKFTYIGEKFDHDRDEEVAQQDGTDPISEPTNTSGEVDVEIDDDNDKDEDPDLDLDVEGDEGDEKEVDDDLEVDSDYDDDIDEDADEDSDLDDDVDDDLDSDTDEDDDTDDDDDDDDDSDDDDDHGDDDKGDADDDQDKDKQG